MMVSRQQHLWLGVLLQAMRDAFRSAQSEKGCAANEHLEALRWIGSRDFHMVCTMAGLNGVRVEQQLRRRLADWQAGVFDPATGISRFGGAAMHKTARIAA